MSRCTSRVAIMCGKSVYDALKRGEDFSPDGEYICDGMYLCTWSGIEWDRWTREMRDIDDTLIDFEGRSGDESLVDAFKLIAVRKDDNDVDVRTNCRDYEIDLDYEIKITTPQNAVPITNACS